mmetsp:Transcript_18028/g.37973  ORF Transcript_18028/g.37973 Transcript_18028/m.37973 type:complete len:599 (-) Transcript_18028:161-1957(-)
MKLPKMKARSKVGKRLDDAAQSPTNSIDPSKNSSSHAESPVSTPRKTPPSPQRSVEKASAPTMMEPLPANNARDSSLQLSHRESRQDEKVDFAAAPLRPLRLGSFNFDSSSNSYTYPSLFKEADDMIKQSNLIYALSELRDLARNGVLNDPSKSFRILQLPLPLETAETIIFNEAALLKEVLSDGKHDATLSALQSLLERQRAAKQKQKEEDESKKQRELNDTGAGQESDSMFGGWLDSWNGCLAGGFSFDELFCGGDLGKIDGGVTNAVAPPPQKDEGTSSIIVEVGDIRSREELVFAVGINHSQARITVCFRGSVTKTDFMADARINLVKAPDPRTESSDTVGIHQGFYEYLFRGREKGKPSKYAEIMIHVQRLFDESPSRRKEFKLYVTGHGSGGALATLFGFYASAASLPLPVTVVSVASPRVGNLDFARTFAELESQGRIRHLRIANHNDPVTLGPKVSSKHALSATTKAFSPLGYLALKATRSEFGDEVYYHTGIKMKLRTDDVRPGSPRCELSYSAASILSGLRTIDEDEDSVTGNNKLLRHNSGSFPSGQDDALVSYHYGAAYRESMELAECELANLTLNNVYREKTASL